MLKVRHVVSFKTTKKTRSAGTDVSTQYHEVYYVETLRKKTFLDKMRSVCGINTALHWNIRETYFHENKTPSAELKMGEQQALYNFIFDSVLPS